MTALAHIPARRQLFLVGRVALGLAVSAGLGWLAIRGLDWAQVADALRKLSVPMALVALLVFLISNVVRAYRWQVLFVNERIPVSRLFVVQNEGIGLNNLVPFRVVSEATQWAVLTVRDGIKGATALATLGMERIIDVVASTILLVVAFVFMPEMKNFTIYIAGVFGFTVVCLILVRFLSWSSHSLSLIRRIRPLAAFTAAVAALESAPQRLAYSLFLSIIYLGIVGLSAWIVAVGMGLSISLATAVVTVLGTLFFATALPAAPGAIGTFEAAVVYILGFFGVDRELALGYSLVIHFILFMPPTLIALLFLPREGIRAFSRVSGQATHSGELADRTGS